MWARQCARSMCLLGRSRIYVELSACRLPIRCYSPPKCTSRVCAASIASLVRIASRIARCSPPWHAGLSFARLQALLLDEYVGLPDGHPESYAQVIRTELVNHLDLDSARVFSPNGTTGEHKGAAIAAAVEGPLAAVCPASVLQLHPHTTVVIDEAAASQLQLAEFYRRRHRTSRSRSTTERVGPHPREHIAPHSARP